MERFKKNKLSMCCSLTERIIIAISKEMKLKDLGRAVNTSYSLIVEKTGLLHDDGIVIKTRPSQESTIKLTEKGKEIRKHLLGILEIIENN